MLAPCPVQRTHFPCGAAFGGRGQHPAVIISSAGACLMCITMPVNWRSCAAAAAAMRKPATAFLLHIAFGSKYSTRHPSPATAAACWQQAACLLLAAHPRCTHTTSKSYWTGVLQLPVLCTNQLILDPLYTCADRHTYGRSYAMCMLHHIWMYDATQPALSEAVPNMGMTMM